MMYKVEKHSVWLSDGKQVHFEYPIRDSIECEGVIVVVLDVPAGVVRRFVVAPTPGTELESTLLVTDAGGFVRQGYVYVVDEPLLRFDAAGNVVYYLEDAMGSVVALVDGSGNKIASFNYDGFGNFRSLSGNTNAPAGIGGDFRFHGAWFEEASGLYHMHAREYDPRTGRFTSRDPRNGIPIQPETFNPYVYGVNNPYVSIDPSGEFSLIEINVAQAIDISLETFKNMAIQRARAWATDKVIDAFSKAAVRSMSAIFPGVGDLMEIITGSSRSFTKGVKLEEFVLSRFCELVSERAGSVMRYVYLYPGIDPDSGDAKFSGVHCPLSQVDHKLGLVYPDFIIGEADPVGKGINSWFIGEIKLSGNSLYNQYYLTRNDANGKIRQFRGIVNYAGRHTHTRMAVFFTFFTGDRGKLSSVGRLLQRDGIQKGVIVVVFAVSRNRGF